MNRATNIVGQAGTTTTPTRTPLAPGRFSIGWAWSAREERVIGKEMI